jgi:hypothetical protein
VVTTISYAALVWVLIRTPAMLSAAGGFGFYVRLSCQFVSVVLGIGFNYALNRVFDWPDLARINLEAPAKAQILR